MVRTLEFTTESHSTFFPYLWGGFIQGSSRLHSGSGKHRKIVRLEGSIIKKFKAIACPTNTCPEPKLASLPQALQFTQEEYEHIDKCLDLVDWVPQTADIASDTFDFWGAAEKEG